MTEEYLYEGPGSVKGELLCLLKTDSMTRIKEGKHCITILERVSKGKEAEVSW